MQRSPRFLDDAFPAEARHALGQLGSVARNQARMKLVPDATMLRPGGIVSGLVLMGLVDVAAYAEIAAHHESEPMAVRGEAGEDADGVAEIICRTGRSFRPRALPSRNPRCAHCRASQN